MVAKPADHASSPAVSSKRFKGVRMRSWGRWVSEIRLPNTRARLWLGSYATAEQAARAFDVAVTCLRGSSAWLNFPDSPPSYAPPSLPHHQIQELAAAAAAAATTSSSAPSPAASNSSTDEESDKGSSQVESPFACPARSTLTEDSDGATLEINVGSRQCSSSQRPISTLETSAFEYLLWEDFPFPVAVHGPLLEFNNSERDMILGDELGYLQWEHMNLCEAGMPLVDDEYPAFAETCLWNL